MTDAEKLRAHAELLAKEALLMPYGPERTARREYVLGLVAAAAKLEAQEDRPAPEKSGVYPVLPLRHD